MVGLAATPSPSQVDTTLVKPSATTIAAKAPPPLGLLAAHPARQEEKGEATPPPSSCTGARQGEGGALRHPRKKCSPRQLWSLLFLGARLGELPREDPALQNGKEQRAPQVCSPPPRALAT